MKSALRCGLHVAAFFWCARARAIRCGLAAFFVLSAVNAALRATEKSAHELLEAAIRHVDRLVVTPPVWGDPEMGDDPEAVLFEVKGHDAIESLVQVMEFNRDAFEMPCLCDGTHRLQFYSGNNFKFLFSFHHWSRLRGDFGGPWGGDASLSPKGSAALIRWFSEHGFAQFSEGQKKADEWANAREVQRTTVAVLLPHEARTWVPRLEQNFSWRDEDKKHSAALATLFPDKADLLITCWRAMGTMANWPSEYALYIHGEPGGFLLNALESVSENDLKQALSRMPEADRETQLGALRNYSSHGKTREQWAWWGQEWPTRLAEFYLTNGSARHKGDLVQTLYEIHAPGADALLLRIGSAAIPAVDSTHEEAEIPTIDAAEILALFYAARHHFPPAKGVILEKLRNAPNGKDKWTLEIAAACYEVHPQIGARHLLCPAAFGSAAELAWTMASANDENAMDVAILSAAARSPSYKVKQEASAKLASLGLQVLDRDQKDQQPKHPIDSKLRGIAAIDACSAELAKRPTRTIRAALLRRRGHAHLELGQYDDARKDFGMAYRLSPYEEALSALCVGRYGQAFQAVSSLGREEADSGKMFRLQGCLSFATGNFGAAADDFTAASRIGYDEYTLVFRHITLLHLGRAVQSPLSDWTPVFDNGEENWPNALISFLQGKVSAEVMLKIAATGRDGEAAERRSYAHWVLAELARLKNDVQEERHQLDACLNAKAYSSLANALALRRVIELDEEAQSPSSN